MSINQYVTLHSLIGINVDANVITKWDVNNYKNMKLIITNTLN